MKREYTRFISFVLAAVMLLGMLPQIPHMVTAAENKGNLEPLYQEIVIQPGQLVADTGEIMENEIYGYVVGYELKKGHVLSISNTDYVFSVRKLADGNYSTMLKQATTASFTATEDMTVGMLIRKPDKSALTAEELASIAIYDSQYGMIGVEGYAQRFVVEAETIDGGTATTRANIFLPKTYTEDGTPTKLIVMTNGYSAYLTDSVWNGNTADNVGIIRSYLNAGYAVYVVNNTANRTTQTPDLGCPQLVDSYLKAYQYIQDHFNVEENFSIHSRSFGTFAAMRIMQEVPELVKCAVMTGPRVSIELAYSYVDKTFVANRFGFADSTGFTYEADKLVGYDPYTDVDGAAYALPPTFWMMASGDATAEPLEVIEKLIAHGNDVTSKTYTGTTHTGICTLNTDETFADALAFLNRHQDKEDAAQGWEQGTIASANGMNNANTTRLRTADYLLLSDYGAVGINCGYTMTNFVYDINKNYLGTSSWIGNGAGFETEDLQQQYPTGVYFRVALRRLDQAVLTVEDLAATGVTFYEPGEDVPVRESDLRYEDVMTIGAWQDGAIHDGKLFVLGGSGSGAVYDPTAMTKLGSFTLDQKDVLKPHANSVCFGSTYYADGDQYPLLYVNVYNNYATAEDRMEGTCCVYRVTETDGTFSAELVQVIRVGFTEDLNLWKSKDNNGDVRPYGNFVVDTDNDKLYAFVMRDADKTTRFFCFDMPALTEGEYSGTYGCNVVTLENSDIETQFDTEYFNYLQGCCYYEGKIISAEGFNSGGTAEPALRIIDLANQKVVKTYYPAEAGLTKEPEVVCIDPANGILYYAAADGVLRKLTCAHDYSSVVTAPTCTEQGYTTHICSVCGDSFVDSYVDAIGHSYGEWTAEDKDTRLRICTVCGAEDRIYRLMLPVNYSGLVYVENNPSGFHAGTRNVAEILGLKSGTFTNGEVTVTIDGTNVTVSGTPAKNLYFDLQTGEFGTPNYKRDVGYSLPDGDYRFGINGSGTRAPTVCIRYSDGSGNLMTASHGTGVHTVTDVSGENFGVPYLYFPKDTAYDFSGNLVLAMGSNAFYDTQVSQVNTVQGTGEFVVDGYLWTTDQSVAVFGYPVSQTEKESVLVYTPGSKEYMRIYLPQAEGYLQIRMNLANSTSTNAYGWRLDMMYACDDSYNEIFPITQSGEYEAAIKLKDRSDFMGMGAHGSERMTSFAIYVDGKEVALEQLTSLTQWETIRMVRYSDFYDPADETTVVARHMVEYRFDQNGLTVDQNVEWLVDEICAISYMMMFPVRRTYENLQITDTYFDDYDSVEYDVSQPGFKTYPANWTAGATKLTLYSEKSGVTASMESLKTSELTGTGFKSCSNSSSYNKLYFTICGGGSTEQAVTAGDVWSTQTRYEVTIKKGTEVDNNCLFGHKYSSVITPETCTEQGYTTHTCTVCGDSYVDSETAALGHAPGEAVEENKGDNGSYDSVIYCTVCGEELSREHVEGTGHLPGDINGDGSVNNKDVTRLFQYLSGWDVEVVKAVLDVNGDGSVNNKDVTRLFQYLSGWDVAIH